MKGIYFLIGITLFVVAALIFLNEHSKYYEGFDGSGTDASGNPMLAGASTGGASTGGATGGASTGGAAGGAAGGATGGATGGASTGPQPTNVAPLVILKDATCPTLSAYDPGSMMCLSGSAGPSAPICPSGYSFDTNVGKCRIITPNVCPPAYVYSGALTNPMPNDQCVLASSISQSSQTPGATTTNPSLGLVSATNKNGFIQAVIHFSQQVTLLNGLDALLTKLSPDDKTYLNSLWSEVANIQQYLQGGTFPYNSGDTQTKTQEYSYAAQYLAGVNWTLYTVGSSTMRQYVHDKIYGAPPVQAAQTIGVPSSTSPGGNTVLTNQWTIGGIPTGTALQNNLTTTNTKFSPSKGDNDYCDPSDLMDLITRVSGFLTNLNSLSTKDPVIQSRIQNLQSLKNDLNDMKTKITNGTMEPAAIPIKVGDARAFLATCLQVDKQLPNLITTAPLPTPETTASSSSANPNANPQIGQLISMARYLKGSITVSFDSDAYSREQMAVRVDNILKLLQNKQISSTDAKNILAALSAIQTKLGPSGYSNTNPFRAAKAAIGDPSKNSMQSSYANSGYMPDSTQLSAASSGGDWQVRPGSSSMQTDDNIIKRGSGTYALYNYADLTSPDYKEKLKNLCAQITASGLGTGEELGCMKDTSMVGNEYGWKGAYSMVCARLQDTWGGNYPQMFGCPAKDPTNRYSTQ
jgi:hypothetical protein